MVQQAIPYVDHQKTALPWDLLTMTYVKNFNDCCQTMEVVKKSWETIEVLQKVVVDIKSPSKRRQMSPYAKAQCDVK